MWKLWLCAGLPLLNSENKGSTQGFSPVSQLAKPPGVIHHPFVGENQFPFVKCSSYCFRWQNHWLAVSFALLNSGHFELTQILKWHRNNECVWIFLSQMLMHEMDVVFFFFLHKHIFLFIIIGSMNHLKVSSQHLLSPRGRVCRRLLQCICICEECKQFSKYMMLLLAVYTVFAFFPPRRQRACSPQVPPL